MTSPYPARTVAEDDPHVTPSTSQYEFWAQGQPGTSTAHETSPQTPLPRSSNPQKNPDLRRIVLTQSMESTVNLPPLHSPGDYYSATPISSVEQISAGFTPPRNQPVLSTMEQSLNPTPGPRDGTGRWSPRSELQNATMEWSSSPTPRNRTIGWSPSPNPAPSQDRTVGWNSGPTQNRPVEWSLSPTPPPRDRTIGWSPGSTQNRTEPGWSPSPIIPRFQDETVERSSSPNLGPRDRPLSTIEWSPSPTPPPRNQPVRDDSSATKSVERDTEASD